MLACLAVLLAAGPVVWGDEPAWVATGFSGSVGVVAVDPSNPLVLYASRGTEGLFKSTDGGATWTTSSAGMIPLSNNRLFVGAISISRANPSLLLTGDAGSGIYRSTNAGASWTRVLYGDGAVVAFDRVNTSWAFAGLNSGGFHRSLNGGATWQTVGPSAGYCGLYVFDLALDPASAGHGYAIVHDTLLIPGGGPSNTLVELLPGGSSCRLARVVGLPSGSKAWRVAISPAGDLFISTQQHGAFVRRAVGGDFVPLGNPGAETVTGFAFDPGASSRVYLSTAGGGIFKCDATCQPYSQGLTDLRVNRLTLGSAGRLYAGTQSGLMSRGVDFVNPYTSCRPVPITDAMTPVGVVDTYLTNSDCLSPHSPGNRTDVYSVEGVAGKTIRLASIFGIGASNEFDPYLTLVDASGAVVASADDLDGTTVCPMARDRNDACLIYTFPRTGTYFVEATTAFALVSSSRYQLWVDYVTVQPPSADPSISVTASPRQMTRGERVEYTVTVTNHGDAPAHGVRVRNALPDALAFEPAASDSRCGGSTIVLCPIGDLAPGALSTLRIGVTTRGGGYVPNSVTVQSTSADRIATNNTATITVTILPKRIESPDVNALYGDLRRDRPTIVLTHGWSPAGDRAHAKDEHSTLLWTGTGDTQATTLIEAALARAGGSANVVRFIWPNAFTFSKTYWPDFGYADARGYVTTAGTDLGQRLIEALTPDYQHEIQFIGHSLGSIVNVHAAEYFLSNAPRVPRARVTALDRPDRAPIGPDFEEDYFITHLHGVKAATTGLDLMIENYYSLNPSGFGDYAMGSSLVPAYNHALWGPADIAGFVNEGGALATLLPNDHSGVQQWYRLTTNPELTGRAQCTGTEWRARNPFDLTFGRFNKSLNPCTRGWYRSLFGPADGNFPEPLDRSYTSPGTSALISLTATGAALREGSPSAAGPMSPAASAAATALTFANFENIQSCSVSSAGVDAAISCTETAASLALATLDVPIDSAYLSFEYRFDPAGDGEHAAVLIDDRPVWILPGTLGGTNTFHLASGIPIRGLSGTRTLTVALYGAGAPSGRFELRHLGVTAGAPERRYLAEAATGSFFDTRFAVLNPYDQPTTVTLRFLKDDGTAASVSQTLAARTRATIDPKTADGMASASFSTVVESGLPVVVDRQMTWDATGYGSHAETAVDSPATTWYLAEGSTSGDFALFYLLQNPQPESVTATIRYLRPFGLAPIDKTYVLPANSRTTIAVDDEGPELQSTDVSGVIVASGPIIAERAMYKSTPGQLFAAGHEAAGVTAPATNWFLAEGATGPFFDLFILLANPTETPADVRVDFLLSTGETLTKSYTVPANGRYTIWVDDEQIPEGSGARPLSNVAVSSTITSTNEVPIIVERTMWWPSPESSSTFWTESHNSPGATATGTRWALAEGEVGGPQHVETYILIANTSSYGGQARVTLHFEDGTSAETVVPLLPMSRTNVNVSEVFAEAAGRRFGAIVESLGATPTQLVVERAMYASPNGQTWAAGTNALATRLR